MDNSQHGFVQISRRVRQAVGNRETHRRHGSF